MRRRTKPEPIEKIRKRFHKEWLLIAVDKYDPKTTTVQAGHLLAHDRDPMEIHKKGRTSRIRRLMIIHSDDWPEDLAAAFYDNLSPLP